MRAVQVVLLAAVSSAVACTQVENAPAPDALAALDETNFRCNVEPILIRDCSYPACHGAVNAPLRVYSVGKLRMAGASTLVARIAPLTEAEHHANYESALGFSYGGVDDRDNLLVRKVIPIDQGGYAHRGGAIFTGTDDGRAIAVHNWLAGDTRGCSSARGTP